jgi:hypothetical protein
MLIIYINAFILTLVIEVLVATVLGLRNEKEILTVVLASLFTFPALNYVLWVGANTHLLSATITVQFLLEALVVLVESLLLWFVLKKEYTVMLGISFAMNTASFAFSLLY